MRIPKMGRSAQYRVTIPKLDGGVNLKDAPHLVEDNQLTDVCNIWWKDQALRTRPGLYTDGKKVQDYLKNYTGRFTVLPDFEHQSSVLIDNGDKGQTFYILDNDGNYSNSVIYLEDTYKRFISSLCVTCSSLSDESLKGADYLLYSYCTSSYYFPATGTVTKEIGSIHGLKRSNEHVEPSVYLPMVTVNGRGTDSNLYDANKPNGTLFEGYNLLTTGFRAGFTSDGKGSRFVLPKNNLSDMEISISYVYGDLNPVWTIPYGETESEWIQLRFGEDQNACEVKFTVSRLDGVVQTWIREDVEINPKEWEKKALPSNGINNDIIITAYEEEDEAAQRDKLKICKMRFGEWFGGDRSGVNGGTRLFVSGNPEYPNLVHWSDINNPLYFPENNYAYVGEANQAVTAFGKQSDMLVIFKENELYYANYVAGAAFTAQDVINGKVVDVTAYMAQFPITQIHTGIGCDCPMTIQLCNNRLIWAHSNGRIYSLVSATPYSERNVRELSGMVEKRLKAVGAETLKKATSGDFDGYYVLQAGNTLFLMDYNSSGYENLTSYTGKNAQRHMPWYLWDIALEGMEWECFLSSGDQAVLIGIKHTGEEPYRINYVFSQEMDTAVKYEDAFIFQKQPVSAMLQTKQFDFGYPERRKTIRRLHIGATDTESGYMTLFYVTEDGVQADAGRLGLYGTGNIREWSVTPGISRVRQFGFRAEGKGAMAVDGAVLKYEVHGEVR